MCSAIKELEKNNYGDLKAEIAQEKNLQNINKVYDFLTKKPSVYTK